MVGTASVEDVQDRKETVPHADFPLPISIGARHQELRCSFRYTRALQAYSVVKSMPFDL